MHFALKRLLAVGSAAMVALLFSPAVPAAADHALISFRDECRVLVVAWTEEDPVIGHPEAIIKRNGTEIDRVRLTGNSEAAFLANDGDLFEIEDQGRTSNHLYRSPEGCDGTLNVSAVDECFSTLFTFTFTGTTPISGLRLFVEGEAPPGRAMPDVYGGTLHLHASIGDGLRYAVLMPRPTGAPIPLLTGTRAVPAGCVLDNVDVTIADECDGTRINVHNRTGGVVRLEYSVGEGPAAALNLAAGEEATRLVEAEPGDIVRVREVVGVGSELAQHTVGTPDCTPPSAPPSSPSSSAPPGGGLPVTGASAITIVLAGGFLMAAGGLLAFVARRRRLRLR